MLFAGVAQLVEQLIRNQQVTGSSPVTSSNIFRTFWFFFYLGGNYGIMQYIGHKKADGRS